VKLKCIKQHIFSKNQKVNSGKTEWFKKKNRLFYHRRLKCLPHFIRLSKVWVGNTISICKGIMSKNNYLS